MQTENEPAPGFDRGNRAESAAVREAVPQWRRPRGVAPGTWEYVNERSIADHYDAFVADTPLCRVDLQVLQKLLPGPSTRHSETVLDLGCGSGRASIPLADRGYDVIGVDLSQRMLQVMLAKAKAASLDRSVSAVHANVVDLDFFVEECVDHAICLFSTLGMVQGRDNRQRMLRSASRIVRPGGCFLLHVHNRWAAVREHGGVRSLLRSWWQSASHADHEFGDTTYTYRGLERMFMHRFSKRELLHDLRVCGWKVQAVNALSIDGASIDDNTMFPGGYLVHCEC